MTKQKEQKNIVFSDSTGRLTIGQLVGEDKNANSIKVGFPMIVSPDITQDPNNPENTLMRLRLIVYSYMELHSSEDKDMIWTFSKSNIAVYEGEPSEQISSMYNRWVEGIKNEAPKAPPVVQSDAPEEEGKIIDLTK